MLYLWQFSKNLSSIFENTSLVVVNMNNDTNNVVNMNNGTNNVLNMKFSEILIQL